jgi:methionyl-tRNA formyltransferase
VNEYEKTNKELMNQNNLYIFQLEKNESKFQMEKNSFAEKITALEDQIEWLRNSQELQRNSSKSRLESKRSSEMNNLSRYSSSGFK